MQKAYAYNLTRREIWYRHDAFSAGLRAAGYEVRAGMPAAAKPGDLLLIWNRYGDFHEQGRRFEAAGGTVVVAENGYLGPGGISPHHMQPRSIYALALRAHNGAGLWPCGGPERWRALGVDLRPWRTTGGHILVCPNRAFGTPGFAMPCDWRANVEKRLAKITRREIRVRLHPGNDAPKKPLADDLAGAWACVIWSSSAGVHSLVAGVPVVCEGPGWICKPAAGTLDQIDAPPMPERAPHFERLAWAQWHLSEIESGAAFRHLLQTEAVAA